MKTTRKADKIPGLTERLNLVLKEDFNGVANQLAKAIKISAGSLAQYLKGESVPGGEILFRLGQVTGRSVDWLLAGKNKPQTNSVAEETAPYSVDYTPEEIIYCDRLVRVLRNPNTRQAILENVDTLLKVPNIDPMAKVGQRHKRGRKPKKSAANGDQ